MSADMSADMSAARTADRAEVRLEPLRWWHLPDVLALERLLFPADPWSAEQFWQELAQPTRYYVGAFDGARLVGYAGAFVNAPDGDVQTVGVAPDAQGRGIGARLAVDLLECMRGRGVRHAMLEVRADNDAAIALYTRLGFAPISRRPRYYPDGCDAVIMRAEVGGTR